MTGDRYTPKELAAKLEQLKAEAAARGPNGEEEDLYAAAARGMVARRAARGDMEGVAIWEEIAGKEEARAAARKRNAKTGTPDDAERLADAWLDRWLTRTDPYDVSRLPGGPDPDACEHVWFPLLRSTTSPHYCYRGCGAYQPAGWLPTDEESIEADAYSSTYDEAGRRYVELERERDEEGPR